MRNTIAIFLFVALLSIDGFCGADKYEIKAIFSPTFETMRPGNRYFKADWGYKLSYNLGIEYKYYLDPDISFSTGILYQDKGYRVVYSENLNPSLLYNNAVFVTSFKYFMVPTNINLHFETSKKSGFLLVFGMTNGYLWKAKASFKRVSDDQVGIIADSNNNIDKEDISYNMMPYSKRRFTGINVGFKFSKYIKSKMVFEIGTIYSRQLNKLNKQAVYGEDKNGLEYPLRQKLDAFIFDIRLGYFFNKQIQNSGKDF
ncbi:MAG: outer membrane beta-barrel protein [Flavobacteriales bacterium]|nr:outer membrane beta-barrel protein [Flavobacteriales bacterium]